MSSSSLALFLVLFRFLATIDVHVLGLIPAEKIIGTSNGLPSRTFNAFYH